jgi:serine/threonine-protein kinase
VPALDHPDRIALLRNAVRIAASTTHPAISRLRHVVESPTGPMLVYDRATGELLHESRDHRSDPSTAYQRFACSPAGTRLRVFEQLLDAHLALEEAGWIACDLYDGCLLVDIATAHLTLIDLDNYRRGDTVNDRGRMFGSTRFMAPEEFELGAPIDFRTTVFTLGRLIRHFGTGLREDLVHFCGTPAQADVVARATEPERGSRFSSVAELSAAWNAAS